MPTDAAVDRFRHDLAIAGVAPGPDRPLGLAVSGGSDSMAMLALAAGTFPEAVRVATVDHRLREGSGEDAVMVAGACAKLGIPHMTLVPESRIAGASLQAQARQARYALLARWADGERLAAVATAHHADDQAETLLMRAARGSGIAGLAAIRARATIDGAAIVRPLLGWRRTELRAIVEAAGLPFVDDPANRDPRHDRTRFRTLLATNALLDPAALARSAGALGEADDSLRMLADLFWQERARTDGDGVRIDPRNLPRDTLRRLARRAVTVVRDTAAIASPRFDESANVEPLLDRLLAGDSATHAGVVGLVRGDRWHFRPAPPRRAH